MRIYVETFIRGSLDELWAKTQQPEMHERWDMRFSSIHYLPRLDESLPQRFLYVTKLGFGLAIRGMGETYGTCSGPQRTSALKFWSNDPKSLIKRGAGYWRYEQRSDGIRFLTAYDYETRFGKVGRVFDQLVFRPLMRWATAWSFDRLRLWIEYGIDPAISLSSTLVHAIARLTLVFIWLYQGLVPKLVYSHADEQAMLLAAGLPSEVVALGVRLFGLTEMMFALLLLLGWKRRWTLLLNLPLMLLATLGVAANSPRYLMAAFNPVTLNIAVVVLALIGVLTSSNLPSASRCIYEEKP